MFARKNVFYLRCFRTFRGSCESVTKQDTAGDSRELRTSRGFGEAESAETPRPRAETHPGRRAGCAAVARQCPSLCLSDSSSGKPDLHFSAHAPGPPPPGRPAQKLLRPPTGRPLAPVTILSAPPAASSPGACCVHGVLDPVSSLSSDDDRLGEVLSEYFTFPRSQARQACHAEVRVGLLSPNLCDGGR